MPELKCTVQTCLHNQNYYCDLDSIKVGGSSAKMETVTVILWKRHLQRVRLTVRLQNVCTMNSVTVMPEKSVWKAEMPVDVRRQNAQHLVVAVIS